MLRSVVGAILGYLAMVVVVIGSLYLTWSVLGAERSFAGDGPYPSTLWMISNFAFGFLAAYVGGKVARRVGRETRAVYILVALMLSLGLYGALTAETAYERRKAAAAIDKSVADLTFMEAGQVAKNPAWYNWIIPLVGVAGAVVGGRVEPSGQ